MVHNKENQSKPTIWKSNSISTWLPPQYFYNISYPFQIYQRNRFSEYHIEKHSLQEVFSSIIQLVN